MLSQFNNEVLSYGPTAVLPQNLNSVWIKKLKKVADEYLDSNFDLRECKQPGDVGDPILMACVYEILAYQSGRIVDITPEEMAEKMTIYAISIIMETVRREDHMELEQPDLENILSMDRIIAFKNTNPEFVKFLNDVCIIRNSEKGWFKNIREKLFAE